MPRALPAEYSSCRFVLRLWAVWVHQCGCITPKAHSKLSHWCVAESTTSYLPCSTTEKYICLYLLFISLYFSSISFSACLAYNTTLVAACSNAHSSRQQLLLAANTLKSSRSPEIPPTYPRPSNTRPSFPSKFSSRNDWRQPNSKKIQ